MDPTQPNHKYEERDRVPYAQDGAAHTRRNSVFASTANSPGTARREKESQQQQRQVTNTQDPMSRGSETHAMAYDSHSVRTPHYTPPDATPIALDMTDAQIQSEVLHFITEEMELGEKHAHCFQHADDRPPMTPESLAELDMPRIINNPKLRHDVNFDRELHFRPNLDGSKGRAKMLQAEQYWRALEAELVVLNTALRRKAQNPDNEAYWNRVGKASMVRLPKIFKAIRDILNTLVPDYDQDAVQERLDVDHIMQQISNGVCDLVDLGNWLAKILKNHCAPMRDALVDSMQQEIKKGAMENKPARLVAGLRQLMNILEAMKLDVANHQIRHMRPLLIEDTIHFQKRYNAHRIAVGKISIPDAKAWISDNMQPLGFEPSHLLALTRGLVQDLLYNDPASFCPQPFYLDSDRLRLLRIELHGQVYHAICRDVLRELASPRTSEVDLGKACEALRASIAAIVGSHGKFSDRLENIAVEIVRVLLAAEGRFPPFDADLLNMAEQKLGCYLRQDCPAFRQSATLLADRLIPKVQFRVNDHIRLSALDLQEVMMPSATSSRPTTGFGAVCEPSPAARADTADADEDLVRRLTHIVCLHWQVWADLVYLADCAERDEDSGSEHGSDSTTIVQSQANSPTIPVAQAVYAPGRRWLPVSITVTDVPSGLPTPAPSPRPDVESSGSSDEQEDEPMDAEKEQQPA